jgi:hypothetical protein
LHQWGPGVAPGKAVGGGAHPNSGAAWRRWRNLRTAAFVGGERAPVASGDGGTVLQGQCGRGMVRAASIEEGQARRGGGLTGHGGRW